MYLSNSTAVGITFENTPFKIIIFDTIKAETATFSFKNSVIFIFINCKIQKCNFKYYPESNSQPTSCPPPNCPKVDCPPANCPQSSNVGYIGVIVLCFIICLALSFLLMRNKK